MITDFLSAESLLVDALSSPAIDQIKGVWGVSERSLGEAIETRPAPGLFVAFAGYSVAESHANGAWARVNQDWLVLVHTYNVRDISGGTGARADAGPICSAVLSRLLGAKLATGLPRLELISPPRELYQVGRFLIPLAFRLRLEVNSETY